MTMPAEVDWAEPFASAVPAEGDPLAGWHSLVVPAITKLRGLAGSSEEEFLRIGELLQGVHENSVEISRLASQLVEIACGREQQLLSDRLRRMASDLELFLGRFQARSLESFSTLNQGHELLGQLDGPLTAVKKMTNAFYQLEVSLKIESVHLGEMGAGVTILAMDLKNLSQQVNDRLGEIKVERGSVSAMIARNMGVVKQLGAVEAADARLTLTNTVASLHELDAAHERFSRFGGMVADVAQEIAGSIGEVVTSLQVQDINRQQLEHVIAGLDRLSATITSARDLGPDEAARQTVIMEAGDVCELQEAQLQLASSELYRAVAEIIDRLCGVTSLQAQIRDQTTAASGIMDGNGSSFVDAISVGISSTTQLIKTCTGAHHEVSRTMATMASAMSAFTSFVEEIGRIGDSIVQAATNAQIKAGKAGAKGVVLATLAAEIMSVFDHTSRDIDVITETLKEIDTVTTGFLDQTATDESRLAAWYATVDHEIAEITAMLDDMKKQLRSRVVLIQEKIGSLAADVARVTARIDVHERSKVVTEEARTVLRLVIAHSRELIPANREFKESLRQLHEQYTMESERRVHQAVAGRHGVDLDQEDSGRMGIGASDDCEFGDNVALF